MPDHAPASQYKQLLDEAIALAKFPPAKVLLVDRKLAEMKRVPGATSTTARYEPST